MCFNVLIQHDFVYMDIVIGEEPAGRLVFEVSLSEMCMELIFSQIDTFHIH